MTVWSYHLPDGRLKRVASKLAKYERFQENYSCFSHIPFQLWPFTKKSRHK